MLKIKYLLNLTVLILVVVFVFSVKAKALDPNDEMPTLYWGSPSASWTDNTKQTNTTYFQGVSNKPAQISEVVRNVAPATLPNLIFNKDCLMNNTASDIVGNCVNFNDATSMKLLNSRSYVNGYLKAATVVFEYPQINVIGDSYNASGNFAYWERHLRQTTDSSGSNAIWQQQNYIFNPQAQAYWNTGNNPTMLSTVARLLQNSKILSTTSLNLFGQFDGVCGQALDCGEKNQYSDGRVWLILPSMSIGASSFPQLNYTKKSTIIVGDGNNQSNLTIDASILSSETDASIGFIIRKGNVTITNSNAKIKTINASIFAPNGTISVSGSNINLTGSFVANDFKASGSNIKFTFDSRGESDWPPGFRDLLPLSSQSR